jgi:oligoendopeptidase F
MQNLDYESVKKKLIEDTELAEYTAYIESAYKYKKHTLSEKEETVISRLELVTEGAWHKFHEKLLSSTDFFIDEKKYNLSDVIHISTQGTTEDHRKKATIALSKGLEKNTCALVAIFNNIVLAEQINRDIRQYSIPESPSYLRDNVTKEIIDMMLETVTDKTPAICHRYYQIKAHLLKKRKIQYWDRAITIKLHEKNTKKFSYDEAIEIILNVFKRFSKKFYERAIDIIKNGWVDVYPADGKASGAFSASATVDTHPFVLLNFHGDIRDILIIAHEFGHAIHQKLSARNKQLVCDPPLNISETASIFAEKLTHKYLLVTETDINKKIELMCTRLDDVMSTIFRQCAFFRFEQKIHRMRQGKELTHE